jgi:CheY-like chemotaxis protein
VSTLLFVDDDTDFLELIREVAQQRRKDWTVFTASTSAQALRLLESKRIDLAVLDLRMPIVDGVQFLQLVHRKYPQMKKALLSSYPDDARRQNALQHGAEMVLTKPLDQQSFDVLFETFHELLRVQMEDGFRGVLRKIGLGDILQMECLSRHTSLLEVTARGKSGRIYIKSGRLVHAEFSGTTGETALNQLLALRGGEFLHSHYSEPPAITLEGSWEFLLMEAARLRDEMLAASQENPNLEEIEPVFPTPKQGKARSKAAGPPPIPTLQAGVLEMFVVSTKGEVLYEKGVTDVPQRKAILNLLNSVGRKMETSSPYGPLEGVEFMADDARMVARLYEDGAVFVRGNICA